MSTTSAARPWSNNRVKRIASIIKVPKSIQVEPMTSATAAVPPQRRKIPGRSRTEGANEIREQNVELDEPGDDLKLSRASKSPTPSTMLVENPFLSGSRPKPYYEPAHTPEKGKFKDRPRIIPPGNPCPASGQKLSSSNSSSSRLKPVHLVSFPLTHIDDNSKASPIDSLIPTTAAPAQNPPQTRSNSTLVFTAGETSTLLTSTFDVPHSFAMRSSSRPPLPPKKPHLKAESTLLKHPAQTSRGISLPEIPTMGTFTADEDDGMDVKFGDIRRRFERS